MKTDGRSSPSPTANAAAERGGPARKGLAADAKYRERGTSEEVTHDAVGAGSPARVRAAGRRHAPAESAPRVDLPPQTLPPGGAGDGPHPARLGRASRGVV